MKEVIFAACERERDHVSSTFVSLNVKENHVLKAYFSASKETHSLNFSFLPANVLSLIMNTSLSSNRFVLFVSNIDILFTTIVSGLSYLSSKFLIFYFFCSLLVYYSKSQIYMLRRRLSSIIRRFSRGSLLLKKEISNDHAKGSLLTCMPNNFYRTRKFIVISNEISDQSSRLEEVER